MRSLRIGTRTLTDNDVYVIAEIGNNHNGQIEEAEWLIYEAKKRGADAVKFQLRSNPRMFTKTYQQTPYKNEFSDGPDYITHRERIDLDADQLSYLKTVADKCGITWFATPFEPYSVTILHKMGVKIWKIASCDVKNIPLIETVAGYGQPIIVSLGGAESWADILRVTNLLDAINPNYALLHCISRYPNTDNLFLSNIPLLRTRFPNNLIGFSSHHPSIDPLKSARQLGASIFEVHFTRNRGQKGTDHGFSMEPAGLERICSDVKRVDKWVSNSKEMVFFENEGFTVKMGKGLYPNKPMKAGNIVSMDDVIIRSPADGLQPFEMGEVIGKELVVDCSTGQAFRKEWFK